MDKLDILIWAIGGGFAGTWAIMLLMFRMLSRLETLIHEQGKDLRKDIQDIDRRLCRIEGMMMNKECCMIKDSSQTRKAE